MPRWKMFPPYEGLIYQGCLNCPPIEKVAPLDMLVAVGFGSATVECGKKLIFSESNNDEDFHPLSEFEEMAVKDPNHSWIVDLQGPLRGRTYQRQGPGKWVLIASNDGFA